MLAVVSWKCDCGMNVKAMYETGGTITKLRCPNSFCKATHIVDGNIKEIWTNDSTGWRPRDWSDLVVL
jgi:hypothetical protein